MKSPVRREGNVYYLFGPPPERESMPEAVASTAALPAPLPEPEPPAHPLDQYLKFLEVKNLVTQAELEVLRRAFAPLRARFHGLATVEIVRDEIRARGETLDTISNQERDYWDLQHGELPWFDLKQAHDLFMADPEEARKHLFFFNEAARQAHEADPYCSYVLPELKNAEVFFWVILRMYRLHARLRPDDLIPEVIPTNRFGWLKKLWPGNWRKSKD